MKSTFLIVCSLILIALFIYSCGQETPIATNSESGATLAKQGGEQGDPAVLAMMHEINDQLEAMGLGVAIESIEFFTIGQGRPSNRIHAQEFRWVPGDPRRVAQGDDITYIVDGAPATGVGNPATEDAIDQSMATWDAEKALKKVNVVKRANPGGDLTIFDFFLGAGGFGNPFAADIVSAGFFPAGPPLFGANTLAFSVTFIFTSGGVPTDINGDNRLDTALNEVYYNDGFSWGIDVPLGSGIDVETVALHENGHSLGIGHFGPPPAAVLNPVYAGIRQSPMAPDQAGMNAVWASWPNP